MTACVTQTASLSVVEEEDLEEEDIPITPSQMQSMYVSMRYKFCIVSYYSVTIKCVSLSAVEDDGTSNQIQSMWYLHPLA